MLVHLRLYKDTVLNFASWIFDPFLSRAFRRFRLDTFQISVKIYRLENLEDPKLFNYFYLCCYFFGFRARLLSINPHFVLGKHYFNLEVGLQVRGVKLFSPLTTWLCQVQPLVNLPLTRDYFFNKSHLKWVLWDLSVFSERKNNTGLFFLEDPLSLILNYRTPMPQLPLNFHKQMLRTLKFVFEF